MESTNTEDVAKGNNTQATHKHHKYKSYKRKYLSFVKLLSNKTKKLKC